MASNRAKAVGMERKSRRLDPPQNQPTEVQASRLTYRLAPVCDTVSGSKAHAEPAATLEHYRQMAGRLWLPERVRELVGGLLSGVDKGRTTWASISGPYGYGKTAVAVAAWKHISEQGYTVIPPLSCSSFDELARGIAALAAASHSSDAKAVRKIKCLFEEVWDQGLDDVIRADSRRYDLPSAKLRQVFEDKLKDGLLSVDTQCYRLVEFLSRLGQLCAGWSRGLVFVMDELQQLLGPLDARSIIRFREFVWGMRTEQSPCGVLVCLDTLLEARMARWAADLLHRIRESGPTLNLVEVYTREFPTWLWNHLTTDNGMPAVANPESLAPEVLTSLGQFVERRTWRTAHEQSWTHSTGL